MTPFKRLKEKEKQTRRDLIMDAAENIFAKTAFHRVQMREIASEVGLSPGSLYTYFPDQDTLFLETALRGARRIEDLLDDILENAPPDLDAAAQGYLNFILAHFEYLRMSQHCMLYGKFASRKNLDLVIAGCRRLFDRLDQFLADHVAQGEVRSHTHLLFAALNGILLSFGRYPDRDREEALAHMEKLTRLLVDLIQK